MRLSEPEADLIRTSFRAIDADRARAGRIFYAHLFELAPASRGLFVADADRQAGKLIDTLGFLAAEASRWVSIVPAVEDLALRHLAYGVRAEDYPAVGEALQRLLRDVLGAAHSPEIAAAWARVYAAVQAQMTAAAYGETAATGDDPG